MNLELTLQLPVIKWTPKLTLKNEPIKKMKLEEMSLGELLFLAVGPAR
jgi:hypothetical protein